jgi:hypothetical protein
VEIVNAQEVLCTNVFKYARQKLLVFTTREIVSICVFDPELCKFVSIIVEILTNGLEGLIEFGVCGLIGRLQDVRQDGLLGSKGAGTTRAGRHCRKGWKARKGWKGWKGWKERNGWMAHNYRTGTGWLSIFSTLIAILVRRHRNIGIP